MKHRSPFLFLDKIIQIDKDNIWATKEINKKDLDFLGHFPGMSIMPGVMQIESMAQAANFLLLHNRKKPENFFIYLISINYAKFRLIIKPNDNLLIYCKINNNLKRNIYTIYGIIYINNSIASESEFNVKLVQNKT
ncbi:MAG: hypothetical protein IR527_01560 [Bacteroides sp.]|nr:MAG: hypothetical protein IR527_01560 [Bacteroides sp.]